MSFLVIVEFVDAIRLKENVGINGSAKDLMKPVLKGKDKFIKKLSIYITISTFTSVRPYGVVVIVVTSRHVTLLNFQFLQSIYKMSVIKVAWHVLRVKNIHSGSPSDP